jgi:hypothetical protein
MRTKNTLLIFLVISLGILSCKKEKTDLQPIVLHEPDAVALKAFFKDNLEEAKQHFQVDVSVTSTIEGEHGLQATFYPNTLMDENGNDITGFVDVELVEIFNKKDMILKNKPTLSYHQGEYKPLISDGEFYISVTQNNNPVFLKPYLEVKVTIPRNDFSVTSTPRFLGTEANDTLIWNMDYDSTAFFSTGGNPNSTIWTTSLPLFNWINCDWFMSDPRPLTIVEAELPPGYDNTTCMVFISFDGLNTCTSFRSYSNSIVSTAPWYNLPIGLEVHFVAITVINNVAYCEIIPDVIEENHRVQISNLQMVTGSELETLLDALP